MKKIITFITFTFILSSFAAFSQTVNDVPIKDIESDYIEIVGSQRLLSKKVSINIDFGQEDKIWSAKDTQVKDSTGRLMVFNSMVAVLNFFSANGYDFQAAYAVTINDQNVYHYLMRKRSIDGK